MPLFIFCLVLYPVLKVGYSRLQLLLLNCLFLPSIINPGWSCLKILDYICKDLKRSHSQVPGASVGVQHSAHPRRAPSQRTNKKDPASRRAVRRHGSPAPGPRCLSWLHPPEPWNGRPRALSPTSCMWALALTYREVWPQGGPLSSPTCGAVTPGEACAPPPPPSPVGGGRGRVSMWGDTSGLDRCFSEHLGVSSEGKSPLLWASRDQLRGHFRVKAS